MVAPKNASKSAEVYTYIRLLVVGLMILLTAGTSGARGQADYVICSSELDRLRRASRDATDSANTVAAAQDQLNSARSTAQSACRVDASEYRCKSARSALISAQSEFDSELSRFASDYSNVQSRIRSVRAPCGDVLTHAISIVGVTTENQSSCRTLRRLRDSGIALDRVRQSCSTLGLASAECRACLGG